MSSKARRWRHVGPGMWKLGEPGNGYVSEITVDADGMFGRYVGSRYPTLAAAKAAVEKALEESEARE